LPGSNARAELFSENAVLSGRDRSMIETGGINRNHVPTVKRIEALPARKRRNVGRGVKQRAEYVVESVIRSEGQGQNRQNEASEPQRRFFHVIVSGG